MTEDSVALNSIFVSTKQRRNSSKFNSMTMSTSKIHILCYGDSLTAGFCLRGLKFVPYATTLHTKLSSLGLHNISIDHFGLSGWTTQQLLKNKDKDTLTDFAGKTGPGLSKAFQRQSYDLLILMAGTNDLGYGFTNEEIFDNLQALTKIALKTNTSVLNLGIPDSGYIFSNLNVRVKRDQINEKLANSAKVHNFLTYADAPITYNEETEEFDEDTLHFSELGYQRFGERLGDIVLNILQK